MKIPVVSICVAAGLAVAAAVPCMAFDSEFNGTWKQEIKLTGESFTITESAGKMHYSNGSTISYDFTCDGKEYTVIADTMNAGHTSTCKKNSACTLSGAAGCSSSYEITNEIKGDPLSLTTSEISADGKTLTAVSLDENPDESLVNTINVYTRLSGGPGLAGKWKYVEFTSSAPREFTISMTQDEIGWTLAALKQMLSGKMDGKPIAMAGPRVPDGLTYSFQRVNRWKISYEIKLKDKTMVEGELLVSPDANVLTDTSWGPGKEMEKGVDVYVKE